MRPAIVIAAFNRPKSLSRLLTSIYNANYDGYSDIPLIISIDGNGNSFGIARAFDWPHGEKRIIRHTENLGLRKHIISCGDLSEEYGSVIVLEDDLFVSPYFYEYAQKAAAFFKNEERIAGISLHACAFNEYANLPFIPLNGGYDAFLMQVPSSWGQLWTEGQWRLFRRFYETTPVITYTDKLPDAVKKWPETSWKKYFYKYMVAKDLYFVYPYISYSTNFGDIGTHYNKKTSTLQTALMNTCKSSVFPKVHDATIIYDAYMELLPQCFWGMGVKNGVDFCVDLYGTKQLELFENEYALSIKDSTRPIEKYGIDLIPIENNIICKLTGDKLFFAKREDYKRTVADADIYYKISQSYSGVIYNRGYRYGNILLRLLRRFLALRF